MLYSCSRLFLRVMHEFFRCIGVVIIALGVLFSIVAGFVALQGLVSGI